MTREELELMTELKRICNQAPEFALAFMAGDLPTETEEAYAQRLVASGERLLAHVKRRKGLVINGEATTQLVINAELAGVAHEVRELPPGSKSSDEWS